MLVAKDKGGDWYYVGDDWYHCIDKKGKVVGRIKKEFIPDPNEIWFKRCLDKEVSTSQPEAKLLRPNKVVYDLWEHAQGGDNA